MSQVEDLANAFRLGEESLVYFREIFLPAPDDVESAPFHYKWSDSLLNGTEHELWECYRESAKALALDTVVPTPTGFTTIGEIKKGDIIFDETGNETKVKMLSPIFTNHDCFKITFDDKTEVVADGGHLWEVWDKHARKTHVIDTYEMFERQNLGRRKSDGYYEFAYRIPVCKPVELPKQELVLDPYILGVWLGDGSTGKDEITVSDEDRDILFSEILSILPNAKLMQKPNDTCYTIKAKLSYPLRELGIYKKKMIPKQYLLSSFHDRLALLQGLMDTDGTIANQDTKIGTSTFCNTNKDIIDGICALIGSLGIKYTCTRKTARLYDKNCGDVWIVAFKTTLPIFRLPRKLQYIQPTQHKRSLSRSIVSVEVVPPVPVRCILVDSPNHLFLITDRFIPTHNSSLVIRAHTLYRLMYPSVEYNYIVIIKSTQKEASKKLKEISAEYLSHPILCSNLVKIIENTEKGLEVNVKNKHGEVINIRIEAYGKGSSIRGLNYKDRRPKLIVIDDPQDLEDSLSDTIQDNDWDWFLSDVYFLGMTCRIFMTANNLGEKCLAERIIANAKSLKFSIHKVAVLDDDGQPSWPAKNTLAQIEQEREDFRAIGKLNIWFQNKMCLSMSPEDQVFKREMFRYFNPTTFSHSGMSVYTTVDWAYSEKSTSDFRAITTVAVNSDHHWFVLDIKYGRWDVDTMVEKLFETVQKYKPIFVGIEQGAYKAAIQPFIIKEMPKRNIWFAIKELVADKKKTLRINQIQPRFVAGTVWFAENASWLTELEAELLGFTMSKPMSLHDDLIDSLAYMEQIAIAPTNAWGDYNEKQMPIMGAM